MADVTTIINGVTYGLYGTVTANPVSGGGGIPAQNGQEFTPTMTGSNIPAGYVASATSEYSESGTTANAWKAFNKMTGSGWASGWSSTAQSTVGLPQRLALQLPSAQPCYKYTVQIRSDANTLAPLAWTFEGSNDGSAWTVLDTRSGLAWANGETKQFTLTPSAVYGWYRLNCSSSGNLCQIDELRMYS